MYEDNKHSGDIVDFDPEKLRKSLVKSGAGELIVDILHKIRKEIFDGITTKKFINVLLLC
jgi:hypothetical protein